MQFNDGVTVERIADQWVVLISQDQVVHHLSGPAATVVGAVAGGQPIPPGHDDAVAALTDAGILTEPPGWSRRQVLVAGAAATAGIATMALPTATAAASPTPEPSSTTTTPAGPTIAATIAVDPEPYTLAAGSGSIWVTNYSSNSVSRINPATNAVTNTIAVGLLPVGIASGFGSIWTANSNASSVSRVDPATNAVTNTITTSTPFMLAAGAGSIWVPNTTANTVSRIDPATNTVEASIATGANTRPTGAAFDGTDVWVTYRATSLPTGQVARIDPADNTIAATVNVGAQPVGVLAAAGSIWVANNAAGTVSRIDPATNTVIATIDVGSFTLMAFQLAYDGTNIWVSNSAMDAKRLARINPATNTVTATVDLSGRVYGILFDSGSIWAAVYGSNTVVRVTP